MTYAFWMFQIKFDMTLTLGNVLTMLAMVAGALAIWYRAGRHIEKWAASLQATNTQVRHLHEMASQRMMQLETSHEDHLAWSRQAHEENQKVAVRFGNLLERISVRLDGHEKRLDNLEGAR